MKSSHYFKRSFRIITLTLLSSYIFITGCEKIQIGEYVTLRTGKEYSVSGNLSFTIDSISEYRCPKDVVCIWGGDVDLFLDIRWGTRHTDTLMRLNDHLKNPMQYAGYLWEVLDVTPYPVSDIPTNPEDIRIRMKISEE